MELTKSEQKFILSLSRTALEHIFKTGNELGLGEIEVPKEHTTHFTQKAATFVTLTIHGELRGCIGKIIATQELYKDVLQNTYSAAFGDPRFSQLRKEELPEIKIEISVLSTPSKLAYKDADELIQKLSKDKPGVVLQQGLFNSATFLPQVWEQLPKAEQFLSHLCQKAGLSANAWKKEKLEIQTYTVENFEE